MVLCPPNSPNSNSPVSGWARMTEILMFPLGSTVQRSCYAASCYCSPCCFRMSAMTSLIFTNAVAASSRSISYRTLILPSSACGFSTRMCSRPPHTCSPTATRLPPIHPSLCNHRDGPSRRNNCTETQLGRFGHDQGVLQRSQGSHEHVSILRGEGRC